MQYPSGDDKSTMRCYFPNDLFGMTPKWLIWILKSAMDQVESALCLLHTVLLDIRLLLLTFGYIADSMLYIDFLQVHSDS